MKIKHLIHHLHTPWAVLIGATIGILIGLYNPTLTHYISPFGYMYLTLLQLCVLPVLISAVVVCIYRLVSYEHLSDYLTRMLTVFSQVLLLLQLLVWEFLL